MSTLPVTNHESDSKNVEQRWPPPPVIGDFSIMDGVHFFIVASCARKIKEVYAHAVLPLDEIHKVVSLSFTVSSEDPYLKVYKVPHPCRARLSEDPSAEPTEYDASGMTGLQGSATKGEEDKRAYLKLRTKVERVLVNYELPEIIQDEAPYHGLVDTIGSLCADAFPNLKPNESAFIVHRGDEHVHISEKFLNGKNIFTIS